MSDPPRDPEKDDLWAFFIKGVKPLTGRDKKAALPPDDKQKPPHSPVPKPRRQSPLEHITELGAKKSDYPAKGREIDRRTRQKIIRGQMEIEAILDLHGLSRAQAQTTLTGFLQQSVAAGRRHVLVITGKGRRSRADSLLGSGGGILRQSVPEWLESSPLSRIVLSYHRARPRDGGDGALYVYLRRPDR